jgi:predicted secreted protein
MPERTAAQRAILRAAVAAALVAVLFVAFGLVAGDGR